MQQIILNGATLNSLLLSIEQLLDAKIGVLAKNSTKQSDYISRDEVAKLLRITLPTLHDWTKNGYLKAYKMGTRVLYNPDEVRAAFENKPSFKFKRGGKRYA